MPTPSESTTAIESRWLAPNADSDALTCSLLLLLHNPAAPATACSKKLVSYRNINMCQTTALSSSSATYATQMRGELRVIGSSRSRRLFMGAATRALRLALHTRRVFTR